MQPTHLEITPKLWPTASALDWKSGKSNQHGKNRRLQGVVMKQLDLLDKDFEDHAQVVASLSLEQRIERAVELLRANEPEEGYYLAFSGGKDSCAIKRLAEISDVKFDSWYNQTTIDPPELVRFIKQHHQDVKWNIPKHGNMMHRVATEPKVPPTRSVRWCCEEYKEHGGHGRTKIFGVRACESKARKKRWKEIGEDGQGNTAICPIVYWLDWQLWEFIHECKISYCSLYDEGWKRLGCVGCPLNPDSQKREFNRWPAFERNWRRAIISNWERWKDVPNTRTGLPRFHAKFSSGEDFYRWWLTADSPDVIRGECQSMMLWTNEDLTETDINE